MDEVEDEGEINQHKVVFESLMNSALRADEARALITGVASEMWI